MNEIAALHIDLQRSLGLRDPLIFGHFLEHFHREIYGGVYDPGSPLADEHGLRVDVVAALRRMGTPILRWPGGCFVSAYHWRDGVGARREVFDKAWRVLEPNTFGTDEFVTLCRALDAEPYICTNAGTGSAEEMSDWVEYCNLKSSGPWAGRRIANGAVEPYRVHYWSIGNENWGGHELGAKSREEWARYVVEAAKMMRRVDGTIKLSAASTHDLAWNMHLLGAAGHLLNYVSVHNYWVRDNAPYEECIARAQEPEREITRLEHIIGALNLSGRVRIAFDEWNLRGWYHPSFLDTDPNVAERDRNDVNSTYTMADAVFSAAFLNACLRHCRSVGMANFSPVVNGRGAIFVHADGIVLRPTYHVFDLYNHHTGPEVLDAYITGPKFNEPQTRGIAGPCAAPEFEASGSTGDTVVLPCLDACVTIDRAAKMLYIAVANLHPKESTPTSIHLLGTGKVTQIQAFILNGPSIDSYNEVDRPDVVRIECSILEASGEDFGYVFQPHSLTVLELCLE